MYRRILIGGMTAAAIVGAGGAALAATGASSTTSGSPSSTHQAAAQHGKGKHGKRMKHRRMLRRVDHARIVVHTKHGFVTRTLIRGAVTDVSASSITVTSADHTADTFSITKDTKVLARTDGKRGPSTISKVAKGDHVFVGGIGANSPVARRVFDRGTK